MAVVADAGELRELLVSDALTRGLQAQEAAPARSTPAAALSVTTNGRRAPSPAAASHLDRRPHGDLFVRVTDAV